MPNFEEFYIGLMSGTSMDAIDAVLVDFSFGKIELCQHHSLDFDPETKDTLLELCRPHSHELKAFGKADNRIARLFAQTTIELIEKSGISKDKIKAIGSHGQTICHHPDGQLPFTMQIGDPSVIAELTGITTIADFRRADMAAGGQGAPLVPAFHQALCKTGKNTSAVINIGGMSNITILTGDPDHNIQGFDIGPGNVLLDEWIRHCRGLDYDNDGSWAESGKIDPELLSILLQESYFSRVPPKSTGREHFNLDWLLRRLKKLENSIPSQDIQRTLVKLGAVIISSQVKQYENRQHDCIDHIYLCGGGVRNKLLFDSICDELPRHKIETTQSLGIDPQHVEAAAFAWLAQRTMNKLPGNIPSVTGARKEKILGGIYYP